MFEWFAAANYGIAAAYVAIGAFVMPQLGLRRLPTLLGVGFFLTCALTHGELGTHALSQERDAWMTAPHMLAIHTTQLAVDWAFIVAMAPWRRSRRTALARKIQQFLADRAHTLTTQERGLVEAIVRSATEQGITAAEVEDAVEAFAEQKRIEERKDEFIAFAAHELRNPVSVISLTASTLVERDALSDEQRRQLLRELSSQSERLKRLVSQLLDLARFDTGELRVHVGPVVLRQAASRIVAAAGDDDVRIEIPGALVAEADEDALDRVLSNLIANARRYGAPPITVCAEARDGRVVLAVEDCGAGVPDEFVPRLFRRFTRPDGAGATHPGGAGLGLAIAAAFSAAQGGELRYAPTAPGGARFEVSLLQARATDVSSGADVLS